MHWSPSLGFNCTALEFLALVLRMSCVPIFVSTIELVACPELFDDRGLMSWQISRLRHPIFAIGWTGRAADLVMRHSSFLLLLWARAVLAGVLFVSSNSLLLSRTAVALMTALLLLWAKRSIYGQDGADQMQLIIWLAALVALMVGRETAAELALWFIAYQACMAYCVAGFAKMRAPGWRRGTYLPGVLGTTIYGTHRVGRFLRHHQIVAVAGSWTVLLFETTFMFAWLLPWPWGAGYLILGCAFHVANAFFMGLGSFLGTFIATYPAVWFTLQRKGW